MRPGLPEGRLGSGLFGQLAAGTCLAARVMGAWVVGAVPSTTIPCLEGLRCESTENIAVHNHPAAHVCRRPLASLLLALPAPAHAVNHRLSGTAFFNPSHGHALPRTPSAYDSYPPIVMTGSLDGCWYTHIETARATSGGVYLERHGALCRRLDGGPPYVHHDLQVRGKLNTDGAEYAAAASTRSSPAADGGFAGATGRVDFKGMVGDPITYVYRGHISLR